MNRRSRSTADSLDLLLDTVCNAFGGVVFISILVVVLLNMTSAKHHITPPTPAAQADLLQLQSTAQARRRQLEVLRQAEQQLRSIEEQFIDNDTEELVVQVKGLTSDNHELESDLADAMSAIASGQARINRIARTLDRLEQKLRQARDSLADVQRVLATEILARSRTSKLPRQRETNKQLVGLLLKEGRLCFVHRVEGGRLVQNEDESEIRKGKNGSRSVMPRVAAGLKIDPKAKQLDSIAQRIAQFDKERHFLAIAVWPDSFAQFEALKKAIVTAGFEYQLVPWLDGELLTIGPTNKRPRVQ